MSELLQLKESNYSQIGKNTIIKGSFLFSGTTHLCGRVEGNISMTENSNLIIEPQATIIGDIECSDIEIYGTIIGKIKSNGNVQIFSTGIINGDISAVNLMIKPGARVNSQANTIEL